MTTDYRALCAELADELDIQSRFLLGKYDDWITHPLANRARAALAKPELQGPMDEEIENAFQRWWFNEGSAMRPLKGEDTEEHTHRISQIAWHNGAYAARRPTGGYLPDL